MKNVKNDRHIADQSSDLVRKSQKHDVNLRKNSSLYFQIGLILCLLGTYGLFEMEFEKQNSKDVVFVDPPDVFTISAINYVTEPDAPKQEPIERKRKQVVTNTFDIVKNDIATLDLDILTTPKPEGPIIDSNSLKDESAPIEKPIEIFDMINVEIVPIYPGCEKMSNNKDRVQCMSDKLARLIQRKFDTGLAGELGLSGLQKIYIQFKIDKFGKISEVITRAPHPRLEEEAERLTRKIPEMIPGMQRHQPVSVVYNLPIVFKVQD